MKIDKQTIQKLVAKPHSPVTAAMVVSYVSGVIDRERKRIGALLTKNKIDPAVVREILDDGDDLQVFAWKAANSRGTKSETGEQSVKSLG